MSRKQGLPERGRGAPYLYGDLTAEADVGGRQPYASVSGRIPIKKRWGPCSTSPAAQCFGDATGRDCRQPPT